MKVVQINIFPNFSTGNIMMNIHKKLQQNNIESYVVWGRGREAKDEYEIYMNDKLGVYYHVIYSRLTDKTGFASKKSTIKLINKLDEIRPDIIHLHNIHGYYINIELLFNYIKKHNIEVIWTLHDCWAFTGHCAYFDYVGCNKWIKGCYKCPQLNRYPISFKDNSKDNFLKKKELFSNVNMTIITPSNWLANLVNKSFLNAYKTKVIYNGVDSKIFHYVKSNFRIDNNLENKKIILGVASTWDERKGLKDFIKLAEIIDSKTVIVLVGLNDKQISLLPNNIIGIKKTTNVKELVEIYSSADIFFNPTYDDNFPTTNIEALLCGIPIITYDTGGCMECIFDDKCGLVVSKGNYMIVKEMITNNNFSVDIDRAKKLFDVETMLNNYLSIIKEER